MTFELSGSGVKAFGWAVTAFSLLVLGFLLISVQFDADWIDYFDKDMEIVNHAGYLAILGGILMAIKGEAAQGIIVVISALSMVVISGDHYINLIAVASFAVVLVIATIASYKNGDSNAAIFGIFMLLFLAVECIYWNEWIELVTDADAVVGAIGIVVASIALIIAFKEIVVSKDEED